jgi:hypothetical protein
VTRYAIPTFDFFLNDDRFVDRFEQPIQTGVELPWMFKYI